MFYTFTNIIPSYLNSVPKLQNALISLFLFPCLQNSFQVLCFIDVYKSLLFNYLYLNAESLFYFCLGCNIFLNSLSEISLKWLFIIIFMRELISMWVVSCYRTLCFTPHGYESTSAFSPCAWEIMNCTCADASLTPLVGHHCFIWGKK